MQACSHHTTPKAARSDMKKKVVIGLPVYNGDNYLAAAIDSILAQSYGDFDLLISDNASTDGTEEICRAYVKRDPRIRYIRQAQNAGAAANHNLIVPMTDSVYFKWAAHDDLLAPDFLAACVDVLDRDPTVVLGFADHDADRRGRLTPALCGRVWRHGRPLGRMFADDAGKE